MAVAGVVVVAVLVLARAFAGGEGEDGSSAASRTPTTVARQVPTTVAHQVPATVGELDRNTAEDDAKPPTSSPQIAVVGIHEQARLRSILVTTAEGPALEFEWGTLAPDGSAIAYTVVGTAFVEPALYLVQLPSGTELWRTELAGDASSRIAGGSAVEWSRDSSLIKVRTRRDTDPGGFEIVSAADGKNVRVVDFGDLFSGTWQVWFATFTEDPDWVFAASGPEAWFVGSSPSEDVRIEFECDVSQWTRVPDSADLLSYEECGSGFYTGDHQFFVYGPAHPPIALGRPESMPEERDQITYTFCNYPRIGVVWGEFIEPGGAVVVDLTSRGFAPWDTNQPCDAVVSPEGTQWAAIEHDWGDSRDPWSGRLVVGDIESGEREPVVREGFKVHPPVAWTERSELLYTLDGILYLDPLDGSEPTALHSVAEGGWCYVAEHDVVVTPTWIRNLDTGEGTEGWGASEQFMGVTPCHISPDGRYATAGGKFIDLKTLAVYGQEVDGGFFETVVWLTPS